MTIGFSTALRNNRLAQITSLLDAGNLTPPVQAATSTSTTGGTLAAGTYYYKVTALSAAGETTGSNEQSQTTTGSTSTVTVSWAAVPGATGYRVYRGTSSNGENVYYAPGNVTSYVDTNASSTAGSVPGTNTAAGPGNIKIYSGTRPATGAALSGNTLLSTLVFQKPSAPTPSGGVLTYNQISADTNAAATGTASWARISDASGNFIMDMSVTATGGGGDIQITTTSITAGGTVAVNSATITDGNP